MKLLYLFLNMFLISVPFVLTNPKDLGISMIVAVIKSFNKPSDVIANLCWKPSMKKKIMSQLFELDNPRSIKFKFSRHTKDDVTKENIIFLLDLSCLAVTEILLQANSSRSFGKPYRWFLIGNATFHKAPSELDDLLILPDSEVYVAKCKGNNSYNINLVYKIKRHSNWLVETYGVWSAGVGLIRSNLTEVTATMRRKSMARETIVTSMVVTDNSSLEDLEILRYPQIDAVTKSAYHQLGALYHFMNATRGILVTDTWGYFINGTWDGMLGHMVEEKAELLGAIIFITKQRMPVIEYLSSPTPLHVKIVFREPPLSYQSNLYLLPFKATVWYILLVLLGVFILSLYVSAYWEAKKTETQEENGDTTTLIPNVGEVTVFVVSAISQQGSTVELKGALGRFVTLLILMVCLLLYTAYSASVVVLLQASSSQIRTLTDLLNSKLEVGSEDIAYNRYFISVKSTRKFGKPYRWIIISKIETLNNVLHQLKDLKILPDSEVYVTTTNGTDVAINLIYKIKVHLDWIVESYGVWSLNGGLKKSKFVAEVTTPMRRKNLARETIVTSMVVNDNSTLEDLDNVRYPEIDSVTKSGYHQLSPLYDFVNASRRVIITDVWGYFINGSWTGILGDLVHERAELPGSVMFINKERMEAVDYLTHPTDVTVRFLFRNPPLSYQNNLYLLPFKVSVWYSLGMLVVILIIFLYVNAYWEDIKRKTDEEFGDPDTTLLVPNVGEVTVFVMSAISQQGSSVELKGSLGRCVTLILLLVSLFLYTAYSASVVVLLQASSSQLRTLTDLLNSKLELGVEDTPYNKHLFATEKEPIRKLIYDKKIAPPGAKPKFYDLVEGVRRLQTKPFAFNCNLGAAYKVIEKYFYEHEKCGLQEITYIQDNTPWQACRKGSSYMEIFKVGLLRNAESGLNARTNHIMFSKKPVCTARGGSFVSVALVDFYPSLLLLLYGMMLSVVLLLAELLHHRRTSRAARKPNF